MPAVHAHSHIYWDANGNVQPRNCGTRGDSPAVFKSGARISVTYNVAVKHGNTVRIEFSPEKDLGFEDNLLFETAAVAGFNNATIRLPDVECKDCTLRVWESGYQSCADIQLTASGLHEPDSIDTEPPVEASDFFAAVADKSIELSWNNPSEDFYRAIILQSAIDVMSAPNDTVSYNAGDQWGNAVVVYAGAGSNTVVSGLTRNTDYHYKIFTADASLNYSAGTALLASTTDLGNSEPDVTLTVMQNDVITSQVFSDAGNVYIQAAIHDFDAEDFHTLDWSMTDYRLVDLHTDDAMLEFDPSDLMPGDYTVSLTVTDNGNPPFSDTQTMKVNIQPNAGGESSVSNMTTSTDSPTGGSMGLLSLVLLSLLSLMVGLKGLMGVNRER